MAGIDVLDKPSTLEKLWDRMIVMGLTFDALDCREPIGEFDVPVRLYMNRAWKQVESVGLGEAYRATGDDGSLATALVVNGLPIHLSVTMPTIA